MLAPMSDLVTELAELTHQHRLVPFLGAGCSKQHLGVDWDSLTQKLAQRLSRPPDGGATHPQIAEAFAQEHGLDELVAVLKDALLIDRFDDALGTTPLQILALELRSIYTTNQDNVFELACESHGRPVVRVSTLNDLSTVRPGDRLLYKFHGSLDHPETLVYTESQYADRIQDAWHFLNIRLRSDLLTKKFLFVGYSFRDGTTQSLFREMKARFADELPGSFLVAYQWSEELDALCYAHDVTCVDPSKHVDLSTSDPAAAQERFLAMLCEGALSESVEEQLESFFEPRSPIPRRVLIRHQVEAVARLAEESEPEHALAAFRGAIGSAEIPESLREPVATTLIAIIRRAPPELHDLLEATILWVQLPPWPMLEVVAAYLAMANRRPARGPFSTHTPHTQHYPESFLPVAAARAVELLEEWDEELTDNFYSRADRWFDRHWSSLPEEYKQYCRPAIDRAWAKRHTIFENPIDRAERLDSIGHRPSVPTFNELRNRLSASLPRRFWTPPESQ